MLKAETDGSSDGPKRAPSRPRGSTWACLTRLHEAVASAEIGAANSGDLQSLCHRLFLPASRSRSCSLTACRMNIHSRSAFKHKQPTAVNRLHCRYSSLVPSAASHVHDHAHARAIPLTLSRPDQTATFPQTNHGATHESPPTSH
jgi:hypothetical protein